ncbi:MULTISPECIES: SusD/RagB family nutrient-binding outer membrane lipoprotein [Niastella]|uniref:SusD/RagB family nutrient-binding outer membrane lipoprotein n=1 Tax=Niastella soli TaxID=2821487 RepID=A0ABS3YRZ9_9BACT|nr:SusD/RagB family nutrient-binding outer membrane lipoprotein [Niastella soli]MBO9200677.1 SusD/RagB family nutrient-binding outer membrane lipoprotein [Niastella soli]
MKRLIIRIPLFMMAAGLLVTGCKKSEIDKAYYNPNGSATASIPTLYSGLLFNERVLPKYWGLYTFEVPMMGTYAQTNGQNLTNKVYEQSVNYTKDRWDYFYTTTIARYREIEKYYNGLTSDADKAGFQLFLETARIFVYDQTAQMVDLWGDIPFSTAGQLNTTGNIVLASYDKGEDVYNTILTDLKRISDYLASVKPDPYYQGQLTSSDYMNKGSLTKWRKYCNSLMLRLAMRISYKDEAKAKGIVQTILGNVNQYPLIDTYQENITITPSTTGSNLTAINDIQEGFKASSYAPGKMVDEIMVPANDPRLPILFTPNKDSVYHGVPFDWNSTRVADSVRENYFSMWDSTTFTQNNVFPGIVETAAEVQFLKAEAYERWGGGNAKAAYDEGVKQSILFYWMVNKNSRQKGDFRYGEEKFDEPKDVDIAAFLANPLIAYGTNNLEKIATQKWIDFGVIQAHQAWAEYRRTKLPKLTYPVDGSSVTAPAPPNRLLYPGTEASLNSTNYAAVKSRDNITAKVFWDVK